MLRRILVPVDGSPLAEAALPTAYELARRTGAEVRLICVLEFPPVLIYPEYYAPDRAWAEEYLAEIVERARGQGHRPVTAAVREGFVAEEIIAEAGAWDADLIAMVTHGRGGLSRLWMGSVADRCIRSTTVPVLLLRADPAAALRDPFSVNRVVVPLDGSPASEVALPFSLVLARTLGVPVQLLHVVGRPRTSEPLGLPRDLADELFGEDGGRSTAYLSRRAAILRGEGADASGLVIHETGAAAAIADRAEGDLLVMATHGRHGLDRAVFGSVSDEVVRSAVGPVVLIPTERRGARPVGRLGPASYTAS